MFLQEAAALLGFLQLRLCALGFRAGLNPQCRQVLARQLGRLRPQHADRLASGLLQRIRKVPVWGTEQNPSRLGPNDPALRALCRKTLAKMHFSAAEEGLGEWLRPEPKPPAGNARSLPKHLQKPQPTAEEPGAIVIAGCEAHVCLLQTALDLLEDEFDVCVVTDACGSRTERNRDAAFDRLAGAGAELVTTEMVILEWARTAEHPAFKDLLALVR